MSSSTTCCCSTSRRTTSTSTRARRSRSRSRTSRARSSSSRTTGPSSTGSRRASSTCATAARAASAGQLHRDGGGPGRAAQAPRARRRRRADGRARGRRRRPPRSRAAAPAKPRPPRRDRVRREDKEAARRRRRIQTLEEKIAALENEIESIETRLWEEALTLGPVAAHELAEHEDGAQGGARRARRGVGAALGGGRAGRARGRRDGRSPRRPASAAIVAIGSEMLGPLRQDTNSLWLSARLEELGIPVVRKSIVGDDPALIREELDNAARGRALVFTTGGLGPDRGRRHGGGRRGVAGRAAAAQRGVSREDAAALRAARASRCPSATRSRRTSSSGRASSRIRAGTAPGFWARRGGDRDRDPAGRALRDEGDHGATRPARCCASARAASSAGAASCASPEWGSRPSRSSSRPVYAKWKDDPVTILASPGEVQLHLSVRGRAARWPRRSSRRWRRTSARSSATASSAQDGEDLAAVVGRLLRDARATLALAESCTGGLASSLLTDVPGSSEYFLGAVVSYANSAKEDAARRQRARRCARTARCRRRRRGRWPRARGALRRGRRASRSPGSRGPTAARPRSRSARSTSRWPRATATRLAKKRLFVGDRAVVRRAAALHALELLRRRLSGAGEAREGVPRGSGRSRPGSQRVDELARAAASRARRRRRGRGRSPGTSPCKFLGEISPEAAERFAREEHRTRRRPRAPERCRRAAACVFPSPGRAARARRRLRAASRPSRARGARRGGRAAPPAAPAPRPRTRALPSPRHPRARARALAARGGRALSARGRRLGASAVAGRARASSSRAGSRRPAPCTRRSARSRSPGVRRRSAHERDRGRARRSRVPARLDLVRRAPRPARDRQGHPRRGLRQRRRDERRSAPTARGSGSPSRRSTSPRGARRGPACGSSPPIRATPRRPASPRSSATSFRSSTASAEARASRRPSAPSSSSRRWATLVCVGVFVLVVAVTRYVSLGSVVAMVLLPPVAGVLFHAPRPIVGRRGGGRRPDRRSSTARTSGASPGRGAQAGAEVKVAVLGAGSWGTALDDRVRALRARGPALGPRPRGGARASRRTAGTRDGCRAIRSRPRCAGPSDLGGGVRVRRDPLRLRCRARRCVPCSRCRPPRTGRPRFVSTSKGIEPETLKRMSEIMRERYPDAAVAALSGPTFAEGVARGDPTAAVIASRDAACADELQCGSLELGLPALPIRRRGRRRARRRPEERRGDRRRHRRGPGLRSEHARGARHARARRDRPHRARAAAGRTARSTASPASATCMLTCTGTAVAQPLRRASRSGAGASSRDVLVEMPEVAEGARTCLAVPRLAAAAGVEAPIAEAVVQVLYEDVPRAGGGRAPDDAGARPE